MPARRALIVANDTYKDPKLKALRGPSHDAEALSRVLADSGIGAFDVELSQNEPAAELRRRLAGFFADRAPDDSLLLHFSCHGIKDDDGALYFATPDTEVKYLDATGIASEFVHRSMVKSRSRRIALFLDCCYSGAFARGSAVRGDGSIDIADRFEGRGHVVITASSAMEYSFEGEDVSGEGRASVFTTALVEGLETGAADRDRDGVVSVDELYEYLYARVQEETPAQTPRKWAFDLQGDFVVAKNPNAARFGESVLPAALTEAMTNPIPAVRMAVVEELARIRNGRNRALSRAAEAALLGLVGDDTARVSKAAKAAIALTGREPDESASTRPVEASAAEPAEAPSRSSRQPSPGGPSRREPDPQPLLVPAVSTDTPDRAARRQRLWAHIRELGFGPHSGSRTWYHPSIAGARFTDKKNNINFERFLGDGKWHVWETFSLWPSEDELAIQSSISFLSQNVEKHSQVWIDQVNSYEPSYRRMWLQAYKEGKANPWY